jgi:hypothetical protein
MRQLEFASAGAAAGEAFGQARRPLDAVLWASSYVLNVAPARAFASALRGTWRRAAKRPATVAHGRNERE